MKHLAILVVDMQKGLFKDHPYMEKQLLTNVKNLINHARKNKVPVLYVCHDGGIGDDLEKGSKGFEVVDDLKPDTTEVVFTKQRNSSFYQTDLKAYLKDNEIDSLIVCGLQTEFCIDATIKAGFEHGFEMYVLKNGTSSFDNHFFHANETISYYEDFIWDHRYANVISGEFATELVGKNFGENQ